MTMMNAYKERVENQKIISALVDHGYQLLQVGQLSSLFCATILLIGLFNRQGGNVFLVSWYAIHLVVFGARIVLMKSYVKQTTPDPKFWKNLFLVGVLFGGICWGFAGGVLFFYATSSQQILIILVIAGITAGAAPLLSADLVSSIVFVTTALIPTVFALCFSDMHLAYPLFGIAAMGYYLYLIILCVRLHDIIKNSIGLRFENDNLLHDIFRTKNQLEMINKKLAHAATHDPLTNLANRSLFEQTLVNAIEHARQNNTIMALFYIDLDNFKEINDAYGHHVGDQLLLQLIERIRRNTRQSDTVARLGGDELTIIVEDISHPNIIPMTANRLCGVLAMPVVIHNHTIVVTASIGISVYPEDGEDIETLLKNADKAMYYVKEHGRNNYRFSSSGHSTEPSEHFSPKPQSERYK